MTNLERLKMEIKDINFTDAELEVYLQENELKQTDKYIATSNTNKKNIYKTALNVLEALANNPTLMKNYKMEDMTISNFHENLQNRIDVLDRKIRLLKDDNNISENDATFIYMFND